MDRRSILKSLSVVPLAGGGFYHQSLLKNSNRGGSLLDPETNIYESLGIETIINCRGTFTILGGSTERPEVLEAMEAATGFFVQYDELAIGVGQRLAELTGAEWGMVSAGCASGMRHVTAACLTGGDPEKLIRIPDLTGFPRTEVITPRHSRNVYDHAIRNNGVTMIDVHSPEELERAINPRTAMIYIISNRHSLPGNPLSLEAIAKIAKPHKIPILMDAAAEDLTIPNVHLEQGATVVAYSGGKAICGPQCAGLLLGDKKILMSAWQASSPHHGPGRDSKIGKEEILGMVAAVEAWTRRDHKAEWNTWLGWLDTISKKVTQVSGVTTHIEQPENLNNRCPRLIISWDPNQLHLTGAEVAEEVARNAPRIAIGSRQNESKTAVDITPSQMRPGNDQVVADRLYGILAAERKPKSEKMEKPVSDISGRWDLEVSFLSGKGYHTLYIEQDGNWLNGSHKGEFSVRDMVGMIEGDEVRMRSDDRIVGDHITFIFSGIVKGDNMKGSIFLGEYLTAEFSAKRNVFTGKRKKVFVPGGPPLAT